MLALDPTTHDLYLDENGRVARLPRGPQSVAQRITVRYRSHKREWAWDQEMGLDYRGEFFIKRPDRRLNRARLADEALQVEDVRSIKQLDANPDYATSTLNVTLRVDTVFNEMTEVVL